MNRHLPFLLFSVVSSVSGCTNWVESDGYVSPGRGPAQPTPSATTTPANDCIDPTGFGGRGCYRCPPQTSEQLLSACTESRFETFDDPQRIPGFSGARPPLTNNAPMPPPFDAGGGTNPLPPPPPAPACNLASLVNPVLVLGATGFPMETIAKAMGTVATIVYQEKGSCDGVAAMVLNEPKLSGNVAVYDAEGHKSTCSLAESHPADIALSTLFAESCANQAGLAAPVALPGGVEDLLGPVNPVVFAAPATSNERAISADAAYRVYGLGSASGVAPWTDEMFLFRRNASSGNQQTVARTLGLPVDRLRGRDSNGSSNMQRALMTSALPNRTLGISSAEIVEPNRDTMKALAFRHYGQPVAFFPDSDPAAADRRNVRDGHYFMWLSLHVLVRANAGDPMAAPNPVLDPTGTRRTARDASVKRLAYVMVNRQQAPLPSVDLFGALKRVGNVPQCAMHVRRDRDGGPLSAAEPPTSCDCAFDAAAPGTTRAECHPCRDDSQCPTAKPTCSFGFCE